MSQANLIPPNNKCDGCGESPFLGYEGPCPTCLAIVQALSVSVATVEEEPSSDCEVIVWQPSPLVAVILVLSMYFFVALASKVYA